MVRPNLNCVHLLFFFFRFRFYLVGDATDPHYYLFFPPLPSPSSPLHSQIGFSAFSFLMVAGLLMSGGDGDGDASSCFYHCPRLRYPHPRLHLHRPHHHHHRRRRHPRHQTKKTNKTNKKSLFIDNLIFLSCNSIYVFVIILAIVLILIRVVI